MTWDFESDMECFESQGCCLLRDVLSQDTIQYLQATMDRLLQSDQTGVLKSNRIGYGIRNLSQLWPEVVDLVRIDRVASFARKHLGDNFGVVRALLFDKPPEKSWSLPWHRDRTIAIQPGFSNDNLPRELSHLTMKAGVPHAIASDRLLGQMMTLRFSIDPMTPENGPLYFLPGSHRCGALQPDACESSTASMRMNSSIQFSDDQDLDAAWEGSSIQQLTCNAGDLFIMRPLLAHSSKTSSSNTTMRRRVIHIELSPADDSVPWFEFSKVNA